MCGISGFVWSNFLSKSPNEIIKNMNSELVHRGPDFQDYWIDLENKVALGHTRLSIIDLSNNGNQPMHSNNKRYSLIFNGEIYNFKKIKKKYLSNFNINWNGNSDTEVLINCFDNLGLNKTLNIIRGMFSICLYDKYKKKIFLIRDIAGEKPLYYGMINENFIFSSEIKSLRKFPDIRFEVSKKALLHYVNKACVPHPYSIYKELYKVEPGSILEFDLNSKRIVINKFWNFKKFFKKSTDNNFETSVGILDHKLQDIIQDTTVSDVKVGSFLSGGIDSSLITSIMNKVSNKKISTFSIGFENKLFDEAKNAKDIAEYLGTDHNEIYFNKKDLLDTIQYLGNVYDEPFADSSQLPTLLLCKHTSKYIKVALTGDGGDEIFGGYNRYIYSKKIYSYSKYINSYLKTRINHLINKLDPKTINRLFKIIYYVIPKKYKFSQPSDKLIKLLNIIASNILDEIYYKLTTFWQNPNDIINYENIFKPDNIEIDSKYNNVYPEKMMNLDFNSYLRDDILVKVDRASMYYSLETRSPFLNQDIIEYSNSLPSEYKLRGNSGKYILKKLLSKYIPQKLYNRPKMGFGAPISEWIRGEIKEWSYETLFNNKKLNEFINMKQLKITWELHQNNERNFHNEIWIILMLSQWLNNE